MNHSKHILSIFFGLTLASGCYSQEVPIQDPDEGPRRTIAEFYKVHGTADGEVTLTDLAGAYGLEVKIDKVSGRRILENQANRIMVTAGEHFVTINGVDYPLHGEVRWRDNQIYLPGEARMTFGDHLRRPGVPDVSKDPNFAYLDGLSTTLPSRSAAPPTPKLPSKGAPLSRIVIDPHAPPLPASWEIKANREWSWIVIHHSATHEGGAATFNRAHLQRHWENGLGYHFVIGNGTETRDGEVEIGSRWTRQNRGIDGAHAGVEKYNKHGIGVCLVGDFDKSQPTAKQLASLRNLVRHLMQRYGISKDHIMGHREVKSGHTECPGKSFPLEAFIRSL